jgi:hypothetical protein
MSPILVVSTRSSSCKYSHPLSDCSSIRSVLRSRSKFSRESRAEALYRTSLSSRTGRISLEQIQRGLLYHDMYDLSAFICAESGKGCNKLHIGKWQSESEEEVYGLMEDFKHASEVDGNGRSMIMVDIVCPINACVMSFI